jgi:hypothetical protein
MDSVTKRWSPLTRSAAFRSEFAGLCVLAALMGREVRSSSWGQSIDPVAVAILDVQNGRKRLPSARIHLSRGTGSGTYCRYTQPASVVRKTLILVPFFEDHGEGLRIPPSPPFLRHSSPQYPIVRIYRKATEEFRDFALIPGASCSFSPWVRRRVLPPLHYSPLYPIVRIDSKNNRWRDKGCCG